MRVPDRHGHCWSVRLVLVLVACVISLLRAAVPDAEIEASIRARLAKSKISADGFQVRVRNGVATLTGKTEVMQHKGVATRLAKAGGAARVENRIEIPESARAKASANLTLARQNSKTAKRTEPRSGPRSEPRVGSPPGPSPVTPAPPPVRRAVVKH